MDCSKKHASAVGDLPVDPLVDILARVPAKSVCRFKCVSKSWLDLITDPHHRKKLPQAMQGLFYQTSKKSETGQPYSFSFVDLAARSMPLEIDPSFSFLMGQPGIRFLHISDSCNGLVLFEHLERRKWNSARLGYIVCNPTTKEWKVVPTCGSPTSLTYVYLAFDPTVSSHFNLVQFQVEEDEKLLSVHAYSCEIGAWSENQIGEQGEEGQLEGWRQVRFNLRDPNPRCPFVNGFLHLIVLDQDLIKIVALDVQGKARRMIPVPHVADGRRWMCYFGESQGQLHYITQEMLDAHGRNNFSIWVLQDYNAQDWVLKGAVNTNAAFGENSGRGGTEGFEVVKGVEVVGIHQHRNVVFFTYCLEHKRVDIRPDHIVNFFTHSLERKLVAYHMDREEVSTIATFDDQEFLLRTVSYVPYF